jgi:gluconokinase
MHIRKLPLVLTIDIGSSSVRALLFDGDGNVVPGTLARLAQEPRLSADGGAEDDAHTLLERVASCVDQTLQLAGAAATQIAAVALACFAPTLLGVDLQQRPVTPLYLYAETRSAPAAAMLRSNHDEQTVLQRTGCPLRANYWPARLLWLRQTQPEQVRNVACWYGFSDYLFANWFGTASSSTSIAAWTGLLNRQALTWDATWLAELELAPKHLPILTDAQTPISGLRQVWAERWPQLAHIPWFPAIGDGAAANLGCGGIGPNRLTITIGTSAAIRAVLPEVPHVPWGLWCYRVDQRRALLGGATSEGGNVFAWLRETLNLSDLTNLDQQLANRQPDSHGLTFVPLLAGERSPGWNEEATASIIGLRRSTTPLDIVQAGLEAVAYRLAQIDRLLAPHLAPHHHYIATGGALANSVAWSQMLADAFNEPLIVADIDEATSRGSALLALEALGSLKIDTLPLPTGRYHEPNAEHHQRYAAAIERQQRLYQTIINL